MTWWHYLLLANIYLVLFYGFYRLLLRNETFFQLNRIYLIGANLLAFIIPLIQADWVKALFITQRVHQTIYNLDQVIIYQQAPIHEHNFTTGQLIAGIYLTGIGLLSAKFIIQLLLLRRKINDHGQYAAFSFFKQIKLGDELAKHKVIKTHEEAHAGQWHSADVLLIEVIMIFNWFNPVIYLYRRAVKHIHEFIADQQAIATGASKADYAMLLFSQTFDHPEHQLINPFFNRSLLKERILMLQKDPSHRIKLLKYGLSAPLFALMLVLSSATVNNSKVITIINNKAEQVFEAPAPAIGAATLKSDPITVNQVPATLSQSSQATVIAKEKPISNDLVFTEVNHQPQFPGGMPEFYKFLGKHIRYPAQMRDRMIQGLVVIAFVIEKDGSLTNIHSIRDIGYGSAEESIRVLSFCPKWEPGLQNGVPVRVQYTVPINFAIELADDKPGTDTTKSSTPANNSGVSTQSTIDTVPKLGSRLVKSDGPHPLYIIDGVEATGNALKSLSPQSIDRVDVLKGETAIKQYGDKGANGVVKITTKIRKQ